MKKITLFLVVMLSVPAMTFAQKGKVTQASSYLTQGKLDQAKKFIDEAIVHEACVNFDKAYYVYGQIYQGIAETTNNDYKKLDKDPLTKAWNAYQKTLSLDEKKAYPKKLVDPYKGLIVDYTNEAVQKYNASDFKSALACFEKVLSIRESSILAGTPEAKIDTMVIFNAGIAAQRAEMWTEAEKYFKKSIELDYEPAKTYAMLANILKQQGKTDESVKYLQEGYQKFPDNEYMLVELINYYIASENPLDADKYLDAAINRDPSNAIYYRAKATLYDKLDMTDKAEEVYKKTLELDPKDFVSQFGLGNIQLSKVNAYLKEVQSIEDNRKYNEGMEKVFKQFEEVIPYFEKANELNPDEKNTLTILKELYFRLRDRDQKYMTKYNEVKTKLESM